MKMGQDSSPERPRISSSVYYILHLSPGPLFTTFSACLKPQAFFCSLLSMILYFVISVYNRQSGGPHLMSLPRASYTLSCLNEPLWARVVQFHTDPLPWFHLGKPSPQGWTHWKQSNCGFWDTSSSWLKQNATLSNQDDMLPTFSPVHTLAELDSLQSFQLKHLSQKMCLLSDHCHQVHFLWQLRCWILCLKVWVHL